MLVLAAASSMSACIIPVAPQFQDPPSDPPGMPYFVDDSDRPMFGTLSTLTTVNTTLPFHVVVGDSAPNVPLWFRAALDYPLHPSSQRPVWQPTPFSASVDFTLGCNVNPEASLGPQHQLTLIVADQQFDQGNPTVLEALLGPGHYIENSWQVIMSCNVSQ